MSAAPSPDDGKREAAPFGQADRYESELEQGLASSGESREYFATGRLRRLRRLLEQSDRRVTSVLDFGCGDGSSVPLIRELLGADAVCGVEPSTELRARASERFGGEAVEFLEADELSPTPRFSLAYCNGVFHHLRPAEQVPAARFVFDRLVDGALFAFFENNPWNPGTRWVMSRIPFDEDAVTLRPSAARAHLREAGFEIVTTSYLFLFPRALSWFRPLEEALSALPLGAQYLVLARKPLSASTTGEVGRP